MPGYYRYCGLLLESELDLPELPAANDEANSADVHIVLGSVPATLSDASRRTATYEIGVSGALWRLDGVGRYHISAGGQRIDVQPASLADAASVRLFLLQPVFALAAIMRGDWMLNASAVEREGKVTAFVGPSASGKSVAAALLMSQGWQLVADSMLRLTYDAGCVMAHTQAPWLYLWPDSIKQLGLKPGEPVRTEVSIQRIPLSTALSSHRLTHLGVLRPQRSSDLEVFDINVKRGASTFELLLHHMAGSIWIEALATKRELFAWLANISRNVRVTELELPKQNWDSTNSLRAQLSSWCQDTV